MASPAKALADLVHLVPGADSRAYLAELRLQDLERADTAELRRHFAAARPKMRRALQRLLTLREEAA